jgi:prepilin-type N-terminal cleavage/methylation domain-containing protein/prepilin-type processing-associated H-X9-DG protein
MRKSFIKLEHFQGGGGFTLIELMVVIAALALLVATILPAIASTRPNDQSLQCLNNMKQLQLASILYAADNNDSLPLNEGHATPPTPTGIIGIGASYDWVAGDFGAPAGVPGNPVGAETNISLLGVNGKIVPGLPAPLSGSIGGYTRNATMYKCPADQSTYQGVPRVRSVSVNCYVGTTKNEQNNSGEISFSYRVFNKYSDFHAMKPSDCFVFVEENPATLDDGFFLAHPDNTINDRPAAYHGRACSFSFADGHAQLHEWKDAFLSKFGTGPIDPQWLSAHLTVLK